MSPAHENREAATSTATHPFSAHPSWSHRRRAAMSRSFAVIRRGGVYIPRRDKHCEYICFVPKQKGIEHAGLLRSSLPTRPKDSVLCDWCHDTWVAGAFPVQWFLASSSKQETMPSACTTMNGRVTAYAIDGGSTKSRTWKCDETKGVA